MSTLVISGASRGIGKTIADMAPAGTHIINIGLPMYDVRNPAMVAHAVSTIPKIDWLVCNAGVNGDVPIGQMGVEEWWRVVHTNLGGYFNVIHACAKRMLWDGSIVLIASMIAHRASGIKKHNVHYAASKGGIVSMARSLAQEMAPIRVNSVSPGIIKTEMTDSSHPLFENMLDRVLLGRIGLPQDVAKATWFLLDNERSGYITGVDLLVDGGYCAH